MNLARHAAVIWRFRTVAAGGLAVGIVLAVLGSYSPGWDGRPTFTPRGAEVWTGVSSILVTQKGFAEGRSIVPKSELDKYADPGRLVGLADLYSKFLTSQEVLSRAPEKPPASAIHASPFSSSQGGGILPVIQLKTNAASKDAAGTLNRNVLAALGSYIVEQQNRSRIPLDQRAELRLIDPPDVVLTAGRSPVMSILALLLCLGATIAVVHILAAIRGDAEEAGAKARGTGSEVADAPPPLVAHWTSAPPSDFDGTRPERIPRAEPPAASSAERSTIAGRRRSKL